MSETGTSSVASPDGPSVSEVLAEAVASPVEPVTPAARRHSELRVRAVSAAVMAVAVVALAYVGGLPFRVLAVTVGLVVLQEWSAMTGCLRPFGGAQSFTIASIVAVSIAILANAIALAIIIALVAFAIGYAVSFKVVREVPRPPDMRHWSWMPLGFLYASAIMIAFAALRGDTAFGLAACAFLLGVVWATDIFAYFVGKNVGGPKLAPRVSPNKTWSGFLGGVFFAVLAGLAVAWAYRAAGDLPAVPWWLVPVAIVLSVVSQLGDLFESWVKRRSGAKDSGRIIPGHGGIMDRIDGLGAAAVAALALLILATGGTDMDDALFAMLR